jgi:hypothetical protein
MSPISVTRIAAIVRPTPSRACGAWWPAVVMQEFVDATFEYHDLAVIDLNQITE